MLSHRRLTLFRVFFFFFIIIIIIIVKLFIIIIIINIFFIIARIITFIFVVVVFTTTILYLPQTAYRFYILVIFYASSSCAFIQLSKLPIKKHCYYFKIIILRLVDRNRTNFAFIKRLLGEQSNGQFHA